MTKYAAGTTVNVTATKAEIERTLERYGASAFMYATQENAAAIAFVREGRQVRFVLPLPPVDDFALTPTRQRRTEIQAQAAQAKAIKQRWRALALIVKAKLEAVESGIVTFEQEFGMHMVLPGGQTVAEHIAPALEQAYATGRVRPLIQITGE